MIENFSFVFVCLCWLCGVGYILIPQCSVRTFLKWCVPRILLCQLCVGKVRNRWLTSEVKWLLACLLLPEKARRRGQTLELENLPVTLLNWIFHQQILIPANWKQIQNNFSDAIQLHFYLKVLQAGNSCLTFLFGFHPLRVIPRYLLRASALSAIISLN